MNGISRLLGRQIHAPELPEPLRVDPGTYEAAARLAALAERLAFGGNDAAGIRQGIVPPDLVEWVQAVDDLRKPDMPAKLRALSDMHGEASRRVITAKDEASRKRWERAALYCSNARTFFQAALMSEGIDHGEPS